MGAQRLDLRRQDRIERPRLGGLGEAGFVAFELVIDVVGGAPFVGERGGIGVAAARRLVLHEGEIILEVRLAEQPEQLDIGVLDRGGLERIDPAQIRPPMNVPFSFTRKR